ncbi:hypothetical protein DI487_15910 [Flavobacterium sediminis]|uniref:Tetratricopeptide repeat protein n=1 Tax=Flavobacterium sediminis TaxID=2201181 RepID=A0A2U8QZ61_9FLAO|nr:tetratricopeptide repeat protein [Flavobacterium sediminis]AWM15196.1 hypothetical protein DI487_15910 [Flavobacterium sediminis]
MKKVILILLTFCLTSNNFFAQHDSKVHFDNSKSFAERKKFKEALIEIDKALEIDSLNRNYLLQKIKIQYYSSKCLDAFETLKKLMQSNNKLDDEIVSYFCDLSDCIQEPEMATEILRKYVDDKKFKAPEMLIRLGQRYYNIKEYDKSVYYYREAIRIEPKDINAIIDLAKILYSFKGNKEAKAELIKG